MQKVLCFLTVNPEYVEFGIPELKSILGQLAIPWEVLFKDELLGRQVGEVYELNHGLFVQYPFVVLNVPNFEQHRGFFEGACREAVMVYKMVLLISQGDSYQQLLANGDQHLLGSICRNEQEQVMCHFDSRNRVIGRKEQVAKINAVLGGLEVKGKVNFKDPKLRYQLVEFHEWYQHHHLTSTESTLKHVYFGLELCTNLVGTAKFNNTYELSKRIYLGPTSTFSDLAFLMCNQALVRSGSIVIDPFVGTAGLLIPAATKGAFVFGSDLDIRVLNGYSVGRINKQSPQYHPDKKLEVFTPKINLNFEQYGLPYPNIIRIDSTKLTLNAKNLFDAIVTDPPYGIRAMCRSVTKRTDKQKPAASQPAQGDEPSNREEEKIERREQSGEEEVEGLVERQMQAMEPGEGESEAKVEGESAASQRLWKKEQQRVKRDNRRKRKAMLPEEEKKFKKTHLERMNRERTQQWEKYDKGKIEKTERETIFNSLLAFARKYLREEGRLVFLYPIYEGEEYRGVLSLPGYEGFRVIDLSENKMSKGNSRILVTLQKL